MQPSSESPESDPLWQAALVAGDESALMEWIDRAQRDGRATQTRLAMEQAHERLPTSLPLARSLLETLMRYRSWRRMSEVLATATSSHPEDADLAFLAACRLEGQGEWLGAAQAFSRCESMSPQDPEPLLRRARALRVAQRSQDAVRVLEAGLERLDDVASVHAALGYAAIDVADPEHAVECFERAVALNPEWPTYLDDLAGALMLCERWPEAARAAIRSLEQRKRNERAWTVYAIAHYRMRDEVRAEQGYRNALRAAREPTRAKGNYGLFLSRKPERVLEAARMLREAAEAHPEWEEVVRRLEELRGAAP